MKYVIITVFRQIRAQNGVNFGGFHNRPLKPFRQPISPQTSQSMPKTKTHPILNVKIQGQYMRISAKNRFKTDIKALHKSGRFTGFSGSGNRQSEPCTGLFSGQKSTGPGSKRGQVRWVSSGLFLFPGSPPHYPTGTAGSRTALFTPNPAPYQPPISRSWLSFPCSPGTGVHASGNY